MFTVVDSWLERLSGGQIRRTEPGEQECMQCRAVGTLVFGAAAVHTGLEAFRARPRSYNRFFFGLVSGCFLTAGIWRAFTPTAPHHETGPSAPSLSGAAPLSAV
eukprot:CAMPEP_0180672374 /NCGR_PEP_ID=MMETSP1037_2-20121125/65097_1 /TAXON_ID=632150 /ORGANISM="Azadinium spinosum, Strain 3D9" /LENGTH=103 /DNA_ID=CAMNT_0022701511 /DNA_START=57 /DNA_END=365 /DNA_ORIENTATION=+